MDMYQNICAAADYILGRIDKKPEIGLILGSGLGDLADSLENPVVIPYEQIPNFPRSGVMGHAGALVVGEICGKTVVVMQGRVHYYEGYDQQFITMPVRVLRLLGVKLLVLTNAAGGVNTSLKPGDGPPDVCCPAGKIHRKNPCKDSIIVRKTQEKVQKTP